MIVANVSLVVVELSVFTTISGILGAVVLIIVIDIGWRKLSHRKIRKEDIERYGYKTKN